MFHRDVAWHLDDMHRSAWMIVWVTTGYVISTLASIFGVVGWWINIVPALIFFLLGMDMQRQRKEHRRVCPLYKPLRFNFGGPV